MNQVFFKVERLSKYFGGLEVLKDFDFDLAEGELVSLIGPNGAGKTTLFNCITGRLPINSGRVFFRNEDITGLSPYKIARRGIGRTFQLTHTFPDTTVYENLIIGQHKFLSGGRETLASLVGIGQRERGKQPALKLLELVNLLPRKDFIAGKLPIGQAKRLELAIALATDPKLLLLDEPTTGMNPSEIDELLTMISKLNAMGTTIVVIEHNMRVVMRISERIVVINFGEKIADGTPEEVRQDTSVIEAYLGTKKGR